MQYVLQYIQVALGREWPIFFFFFGEKTFTHAQYINIMHALDSKRQKFDKTSRTCGRNAAANSDVEFLSNLIR